MTRNFTQNFVGGRRVDPLGANFIEVRSPYDGSQVGAVPPAAQADVDLAVATARKAFTEGAWPRMPVVDRIAVIRRFAERMRCNVLIIGAMETLRHLRRIKCSRPPVRPIGDPSVRVLVSCLQSQPA
ncbi:MULTISPECIES: aldehyde dehydrogenase family protein [unclassified Mesorhizobium]|uniref:aldehyde dehydrogenase family protein n=1 Tax=unclassified Mesorhizobium TaxID=325217 RepID=UPI001128A4BB|nr:MULTISPECIES: aldehyde dehydrogenase family protein [unclassified Mesorhizobium]MBZ9811267.1 aldehyde dehydrogenase family protein [Mesorhizobium sp. ESP-6-2]TPM25841.1 aldehyde dehydrogenase family protein [Mesorhizobium sp. B2-2-2]